jgi:ABC-type multidrug transport system ATPase subunit
LLTRPPLLVLDEPTSGLDPGLEARTMELLSSVARSGRIVLVATHAMESLERADALCVLMRGRVVFFGPPRSALAYFRVERYAALFQQLDKQTPRAWGLTLDADPDLRAFLDRPGAVLPPAERALAASGGPDASAPADADDLDADAALTRLKARMARGDGA